MPGTMRLPVKLTEDEVLAKGRSIAALLGKITALQDKAKEAAADFKSREKLLTLDRDELQEEIETGTEKREVDVIERANLSLRTIETVRCDTMAVVHSRPMNEFELRNSLQPELTFESNGQRFEGKSPTPRELMANLDKAIDAVGDSLEKSRSPLPSKPLTATVKEHVDDDPEGKCINPSCKSPRAPGRNGRCRPCAVFMRRHGTERHPGPTVVDESSPTEPGAA